MTIIWNTDDLKRVRPSPFDEARWGLAIIEDSLGIQFQKCIEIKFTFVKNIKKSLKNFNHSIRSWMVIEMAIQM